MQQLIDEAKGLKGEIKEAFVRARQTRDLRDTGYAWARAFKVNQRLNEIGHELEAPIFGPSGVMAEPGAADAAVTKKFEEDLEWLHLFHGATQTGLKRLGSYLALSILWVLIRVRLSLLTVDNSLY